MFSSLSESGFIPTEEIERVIYQEVISFSSLSESGFIPTAMPHILFVTKLRLVLISFREWLHSYIARFVW